MKGQGLEERSDDKAATSSLTNLIAFCFLLFCFLEFFGGINFGISLSEWGLIRYVNLGFIRREKGLNSVIIY